jgi:hypothetical protein
MGFVPQGPFGPKTQGVALFFRPATLAVMHMEELFGAINAPWWVSNAGVGQPLGA